MRRGAAVCLAVAGQGLRGSSPAPRARARGLRRRRLSRERSEVVMSQVESSDVDVLRNERDQLRRELDRVLDEVSRLRTERNQLSEVVLTLLQNPQATAADVNQIVENIMALPRFGAPVDVNVSHTDVPKWSRQSVAEVWRFLPSVGLGGFTTNERWNCHAREEGERWRRVEEPGASATVATESAPRSPLLRQHGGPSPRRPRRVYQPLGECALYSKRVSHARCSCSEGHRGR